MPLTLYNRPIRLVISIVCVVSVRTRLTVFALRVSVCRPVEISAGDLGYVNMFNLASVTCQMYLVS